MDHKHNDTLILEHHHTVKDELICHFPYAIFSVVLSMIVVGLLATAGLQGKQFKHMFHLFHYLHLVFAATGVILTYRRFSKNVFGALMAGILVPATFCTLSDMIIPVMGGYFINLEIGFHWCFMKHLSTVLPFLIAGIINGFVMSSHTSSNQLLYSTGSHFAHIFISSMASILYLFSFGFSGWAHHLAFIFLLLIIAVLIPCTLADVVVPMLFARSASVPDEKNKELADTCCLGSMAQKSTELCGMRLEDAKNQS